MLHRKNKQTTPEPAVLKHFSISRVMLNRYRLGFISGKYAYPPRLKEGVDWVRVGVNVFYYDSGLDFIRKRHEHKIKNMEVL